jgi:DNA invertase Pin-like site-specific DNA recombinase
MSVRRIDAMGRYSFSATVYASPLHRPTSRAKKAGVYTGGKPRIEREKVRELAEAGHGPAALARGVGVSRMSVYRILREEKPANAG